MAIKLVILTLSFKLPILIMLLAMFEAKNKDIRFARAEIAGNRYLRPLLHLQEQLSRHWWLARRAHGGEEAVAEDLAAARARIDGALRDLRAVDTDLGPALGFTAAELKRRGQEQLSVGALQDAWERARDLAPAPGGAATALDEAHHLLLGRVASVISYVGDSSNLILDPDLDSYYLMDVTLLALPALGGHLAEAVAFLEHEAAGNPVEHVEGMVRAAAIESGDLDRVRESARRATAEDGNFYGASATLQDAAPRHGGRVVAAVAPVVAALRRAGEGRAGAPAAPAALRADASRALSAITAAHLALLDELDALLRVRIAAFEQEKLHALWNAGLALAFSLALAAYISLDLMKRVRAFIGITRRIAGGDLSARVRSDAGDEIGQLSRSFDDMADRTLGLTEALEARNRELAGVNQGLEDRVRERTAAIQLLLDSIGEALLSTDLDGAVLPEHSRRTGEWFGEQPAGRPIWELLCDEGSPQAEYLRLGYQQLRDDFLPFEVTADQLPRRVRRGGTTYDISYKPVRQGGALRAVLLVIRDATSELERERAEQKSRELQTIIGHLLRDRQGFNQFVQDCSALVEGLVAGDATAAAQRRDLHTLKGNAAVYGLLSLSQFCHGMEDRMAEEGGAASAADLQELSRRWSESIRTIESFFAEDPARMRIQIRDTEYERLLSDLQLHREYEDILQMVHSWRYEHTYSRLSRLRGQALRVAQQLDRELEVVVEDNELRVPAEVLAEFWAQLIHVVRNAVDHGIEPREERLLHGKPERGRLRLGSGIKDGDLIITVEDDGRGIDWERVRRRALRMGLPARSDEDLRDALFADGLTTRDEVSDLSGRGVGLCAVRAACAAASGSIAVAAWEGQGTTFEFHFPLAAHPGLERLGRRAA